MGRRLLRTHVLQPSNGRETRVLVVGELNADITTLQRRLDAIHGMSTRGLSDRALTPRALQWCTER